jgi:3-isopropylmalate dehydratase
MSPVMAAAAALTGKLTDVRKVTDWNSTPTKVNLKLEMAAEVADLEDDDEIERLGDYPEDGQQSGVDSTKGPSVATGMPPFTTLRGIGRPRSICISDQADNLSCAA